jgi:uncharacterized protein (TIGR02301 family)
MFVTQMFRTATIFCLLICLGAVPAGAQQNYYPQPGYGQYPQPGYGQPSPQYRLQPQPFGGQPQYQGQPSFPAQQQPRPFGPQPQQQLRANLPPGQQQPQPAPPQNTPAPYDRDLQRLSEILGSLHFLRAICGANEGQKWRNEAQVLIDTEAPNGERHEQMIASFNRGYRAFQQSYRNCTPAADFAIRRYLAEGAKIAREITARYAN